MKQESLNNSTSATNYGYNNRGFLSSISNPSFTESVYYSGGYNGTSYCNGSIASDTFAYPGGPSGYNYTYTYSYDQYNKMTNAANSSKSTNTYTPIKYDNNGNITSRGGGPGAISYLYSGNRPVECFQANGEDDNLYYDNDGNLTSNAGEQLTSTYDPFTLMTTSMTESGTTVNYQYDGRKERLLKTVSGTSTLYLRGTSDYPLTQKTGSATSSTTRFYVYGPTGIIAVVDGGSNYFVVKDHLGSTRVVLNSGSAPISWYDCDCYGYMWKAQASEDPSYKFTGQEYDQELGLYNFRAREYDPALGIFCAADAAGQGFSPYMYCGGNPTMYIDKDGRFIFLIPIIIGAIIGGYEGHQIGEANGAHGWGLFAYTLRRCSNRRRVGIYGVCSRRFRITDG